MIFLQLKILKIDWKSKKSEKSKKLGNIFRKQKDKYEKSKGNPEKSIEIKDINGKIRNLVHIFQSGLPLAIIDLLMK